MPNHCMNRMVITGDEESVKAFVEQAKGEEGALDLNSFLPMPVEIRNTAPPNRDEKLVAKHGRHARYNWALANWGTKWGCYYVHFKEVEAGSLEYEFCTAWCTFDENVLIVMSAAHPSLHFELIYAESGCGLWGRRIAQGGHLLLDDGGSLEQFDGIPQEVRWLAGLE